jgi:CheY-like chemotaxis protein
MTPRHSLEGLTVLLVEDESMVAMLAEDALLEAGCTVLLAMRLKEALALARDAALDLAVLDVNLGGGRTGLPIADLLISREIPFLFATGYAADMFDLRYAAYKRLRKPYSPGALVQAASQVASQRA